MMLLTNGILAAGPIYIGELAPPEIRGKIMSFWQMFYSVGSFIAYWYVGHGAQSSMSQLFPAERSS